MKEYYNMYNTLADVKNIIIEKYNSGLSMDKIAKEFNCNSGTVSYYLKKWNINVRKMKRFKGDIENYDEQIISMYNSGVGCKTIAKKLNICSPLVLKRLHKYNIVRKSDVDYDNLLKDKLKEVIQLFESGNSINFIAKKLGYNSVSVINLLRKHGYNTYRYKCKYSLNEDYFKKIDTQNKAYQLGWWYSDGNVLKSGKCRISIQAEDQHILYDFIKELNYTGQLLTIKKDGKRKIQKCLNIDRLKFAQDLMALGVIPNKSLVLQFPALEQVSEEFIPHFLRGMFDGDGSIFLRKKKYISCGITSTDTFCDSITKYLEKFDIYPTNFYYRRKGKSTGSLFFGRQKDAIKFMNFIYKDASLKLNRKYQKAIPFLTN